jgi:hypothetical protein
VQLLVQPRSTCHHQHLHYPRCYYLTAASLYAKHAYHTPLPPPPPPGSLERQVGARLCGVIAALSRSLEEAEGSGSDDDEEEERQAAQQHLLQVGCCFLRPWVWAA